MSDIHNNTLDGDDDGDEFYDVLETTMPTATPAEPSASELEKCGHWLLSIPRDNVLALQQQAVYSDFIKAFERLGQAHCRLGLEQKSLPHAADDVILKILEYLESTSLLPMARTCVRMRDLAVLSATQRTQALAQARQWNHNPFMLLRAQEQMEGTYYSGGVSITGGPSSHVAVPLLGLEQRVVVTDAGDAEYNGIYHCTSVDGNGFVFTKPRMPATRATLAPLTSDTGAWSLLEEEGGGRISAGNMEESAQPGQLLRCIIAKRFSNEVSAY